MPAEASRSRRSRGDGGQHPGSSTPFTIGFVADAVNILFFIAIALVLYVLLSPASRKASATFVVFAAIAVAIMGSGARRPCRRAGARNRSRVRHFPGGTAPTLSGLFLTSTASATSSPRSSSACGWRRSATPCIVGLLPAALGVGLVVGAVGYVASFSATVLRQAWSSRTWASSSRCRLGSPRCLRALAADPGRRHRPTNPSPRPPAVPRPRPERPTYERRRPCPLEAVGSNSPR